MKLIERIPRFLITMVRTYKSGETSNDEQTLVSYWFTSRIRKEVKVVLESYCIIVCQSY
jgi:hypothetical protein